jgi:macrodomain Ter protein organizer (MatP/YcbG family)
MAEVVKVSETERLPVKVKIEYQFKNPFEGEKKTPSKISMDVEIFLTRDETMTLEKIITDKIIEILNTILEARKLEQGIDTLTEDLKQVLDADPA